MKRLFDILVSFTAIVVLSPVILITYAVILRRLGSPVFFVQERPGMNEVPFNVYKFRTMREAYGADGEALADEERMTKTGAAIRKMSLDELPQLFNVLKGDMSLVGPRPLLMEYLPLYSERQRKRHSVRPGITGMAQVNGRNAISWTDKFELDVWYVENRSLFLDIKIIFQTAWKILRRSDVSQAGRVTVDKFDGKN